MTLPMFKSALQGVKLVAGYASKSQGSKKRDPHIATLHIPHPTGSPAGSPSSPSHKPEAKVGGPGNFNPLRASTKTVST